MITKTQKTKDINTVLLATYRKLEKAKNFNTTFFYNMAVMDDSIRKMADKLNSVYSTSLDYFNTINALRRKLYMRIYDLYSDAINAIKKWNEDIERGPELQQELLEKQLEYNQCVVGYTALYAEWQTMVEAYNAWYTNTYLPTYQTYETAIATARQLRDNNLALKQNTWDTYRQSHAYFNYTETEEFYHYVFDPATSDPYGTLEARLAQLFLYTDQDVVIKSCFTYVYDENLIEHTLKYIIRVRRAHNNSDTDRFIITYEYELDYASPVVMAFDRSPAFDTGGGYKFIDEDDQESFVETIRHCLNSDSMPNATYCFKAVHENAVTYNNNIHTLMDQYQANADAAQTQMNELQSQEDALVRQKNDLWDATVDKHNEWTVSVTHSMDVYKELADLTLEWNNLTLKTMNDYLAAVKASIIYNDAVTKAHEEQEKQGQPLASYPALPTPFNLFNSQTVPQPDDDTPDMPDEPVPVPEEEEEEEDDRE